MVGTHRVPEKVPGTTGVPKTTVKTLKTPPATTGAVGTIEATVETPVSTAETPDTGV